jgi:hypothetical protein
MFHTHIEQEAERRNIDKNIDTFDNVMPCGHGYFLVTSGALDPQGMQRRRNSQQE